MEKQIVKKVEDWAMVANELLETLRVSDTATVISLSGDLGSGKTTFVQAIAKALGVAEPITSPTFNIYKRYGAKDDKFKNLVHMDAYRIESEDELTPLRFEDVLAMKQTLICVEWAEKISNSMPKDAYRFKLEINKENQHTIQSLS